MKYYTKNGYMIDPIFEKIFRNMNGWNRTNNILLADFIYMPLRLNNDTNYSLFSNAKYSNNFIDSNKKMCKLSDNCMNNKILLYKVLKNKSYIPESYIYNQNNYTKFKNIIKNNEIYIIKPESEFARKGMAIINNFQDIDTHIKKEVKNGWIFQKYIKNPLLYKNKKFHIRIYTLVIKKKNMLYAYIHNIGYVYLANENFTLDSLDFDIHMTGAKYCNVHTFNDYINYFGKDSFMNIWKQIKYIVKDSVDNFDSIKTFNSINNNTSFHLFAYDILIDSNQKAYLLEINNGIIGFESLPSYKHMCKNKSEPKMHPYHFLEKLFHDITHLVINNQSNGFELCLKKNSIYNFNYINKIYITFFIIFLIMIFIKN
jgi:hypothetical protein